MPWAKGVFDALDDPTIREVVLIWATRLGKTMIGLQWTAGMLATNPLPGIFGTATESLAKRIIRRRLYTVLSHIRQLRFKIPNKRFRSHREVKTTEASWDVVWSGSESLIADTTAKYGWANEVDKWTEDKSAGTYDRHGDPLARFEERLKEWPDRKILYECSPSLAGSSRIGRKWAQSDQRYYWVPCPHCCQYQKLKMGSADPDSGGLKFDRTEEGSLDQETARQTARYICEHCKEEIHDRDRAAMMRAGRWVPVGCACNAVGKLCGTPERRCQSAGFQLSSLYSLQHRWGDIAAAFVKAQTNQGALQTFVNDWLGELWEPYRKKSDPEKVAERLRSDQPVGRMPAWSTWLFAAVDVQADHFKWVSAAAGPNERLAVIDRGCCDTWDEVRSQVVDAEVPHEDGGPPLRPCLTFIDSGDGNRTKEVYEKCREWSRPDRLVVPCKGANDNCNGAPYQKRTVVDDGGRKSKAMRRQAIRTSGTVFVRVNPFYWEPVLQNWFDESLPGEPDSLSLPSELAADIEFVRELCNAAQSHEPSRMVPDRFLWVKRWPDEPNDYRDCLKYIRCAIDVKFRGNWRLALRRQTATVTRPAQATAPVSQPIERSRPAGRRRRYHVRRERMARR